MERPHIRVVTCFAGGHIPNTTREKDCGAYFSFGLFILQMQIVTLPAMLPRLWVLCIVQNKWYTYPFITKYAEKLLLQPDHTSLCRSLVMACRKHFSFVSERIFQVPNTRLCLVARFRWLNSLMWFCVCVCVSVCGCV